MNVPGVSEFIIALVVLGGTLPTLRKGPTLSVAGAGQPWRVRTLKLATFSISTSKVWDTPTGPICVLDGVITKT